MRELALPCPQKDTSSDDVEATNGFDLHVSYDTCIWATQHQEMVGVQPPGAIEETRPIIVHLLRLFSTTYSQLPFGFETSQVRVVDFQGLACPFELGIRTPML